MTLLLQCRRLCPHFHFSMSNSSSVMCEQSVLFALQCWRKWLFTCTNTSRWIIHKNKHLGPGLKPFHCAISKAGRFFLLADGENREFDCPLISENKNAVWNWNIDLLHCNHLLYYTRDSMCELECKYILWAFVFFLFFSLCSFQALAISSYLKLCIFCLDLVPKCPPNLSNSDCLTHLNYTLKMIY